METVLSYGDTKLRGRDVDLLEGPHWLNDMVRLCSRIFHA